MPITLNIFALLLLLLCYPPAYAGNALVDSKWLKAHLTDPTLYLLDIQTPERYRQSHLHGAINAPYKHWRTDKQSTMPGMLPPLDRLEKLFSTLGIRNDHHIIIIATGTRPSDMSAASRVFWTLKVMGHKKVALLNGGLAAYAEQFRDAMETRPNFGIPTKYRATPDTRPVANLNTVKAAIRKGDPLLDARTLGEYMGVFTARADERAGTLPGAHHLPFDWLVDSSGKIRDKHAITTLFTASGLNTGQDGTIHFCHSGNRAALTWFADYAILGHHAAKLYDASMREWAVRKTLPMEIHIDLTTDAQRQ